MKEITKTYKIYEFDELSEEAKERAISDHIEFEIEIYNPNNEFPSYIDEAVKEAERLQTPWFLGSIIYERNKEDIIEAIKANKYGFYGSGELIGLDMYPDGWMD